jgi:hypothetical protein
MNKNAGGRPAGLCVRPMLGIERSWLPDSQARLNGGPLIAFRRARMVGSTNFKISPPPPITKLHLRSRNVVVVVYRHVCSIIWMEE